MKKDPKRQKADRLLKQLPLSERRRQQQIRSMIMRDPELRVRG